MTTDLVASITRALDYCRKHNIEIPLDVQLQARRYGAWKADARDLTAVAATYHDRITSALITYFEGGGSVTGPRNQFRQAAVEALGDGFDLGYRDGDGALPYDRDVLDWLNARIEQELGFIGTVFEQAKVLRKEEDADWLSWVSERADGYTRAVYEMYSVGQMFAKPRQLLTWVYGDTEHCSTCNSLNGQRHRAQWYLSRNYIPRKPGASLECGGYRCQCSLKDSKGNTVTL